MNFTDENNGRPDLNIVDSGNAPFNVIRTLLFCSLLPLSGALLVSPSFAETGQSEAGDDAQKWPEGRAALQKCVSCHQFSDPASNEAGGEKDAQIGPNLYNVFGREIGAYEGYEYSEILKTVGESGQIWDIKTLDAYLSAPEETFPGTSMSFLGIEDDLARSELIALFMSGDETLAEALGDVGEDPPVSDEILAISGDAEYGEYLSSSCLGCHQADGSDKGLPSIMGWPEGQFVRVMHAYKNKSRANQVMQQHAGALSDEEIAALAAYFGAL